MRSVLTHSSERGPEWGEMQTECTPEEGRHKGHPEVDEGRWRWWEEQHRQTKINWGHKKFRRVGEKQRLAYHVAGPFLFRCCGFLRVTCPFIPPRQDQPHLVAFGVTFEFLLQSLLSQVRRGENCKGMSWFLPWIFIAAHCIHLGRGALPLPQIHNRAQQGVQTTLFPHIEYIEWGFPVQSANSSNDISIRSAKKCGCGLVFGTWHFVSFAVVCLLGFYTVVVAAPFQHRNLCNLQLWKISLVRILCP